MCSVESIIIVFRLDKDNDHQIDWKEWRDYFHLVPVDNLIDLIVYWRQTLVCRTGVISVI